MSDAVNHEIFISKNDTRGVMNANPVWTPLRKTSVSLALVKNTLTSAELKKGRMPGDTIHGTKQVSGDIGGEVSYGSYDALFEAALCGTWTVPAAAVTGDWKIQPGSFANAFTGATFPVNLAAGVMLKVSGFGAVVDGFYMVAQDYTAADTVLYVTYPDGTIPPWGDAGEPSIDPAGATAKITPLATLKPGETRRDFTVMRKFGDQVGLPNAKPFHIYEAIEINTLAISVAAEAITTVTFGVAGRDAGLLAAHPAGSTYGNITTTPVMNSFTGHAKEGNNLVASTEITLNLDNGITPEYVIGSAEPYKNSIAISNITGQMTIHFNDPSIIEKYYNEEEGSIDYQINDRLGNGYLFVIPRTQYTGAQPDTGGPGSIFLPVPFAAQEVGAEGYHFILCKIPAGA